MTLQLISFKTKIVQIYLEHARFLLPYGRGEFMIPALSLFEFVRLYMCKGVYPQSDGGLVIVRIDASKGFVDLWVHLTFAIFDNFYLKKTTEMAFDQDLTCLIFPLMGLFFYYNWFKYSVGTLIFDGFR